MTAPVHKYGERETVVLEDDTAAQVYADAEAHAQALAGHLADTARVLDLTPLEVLDLLVGEAPPLRSYRVTLDRPVPPARPRRSGTDARARRRAARRARRLNR
jgi:hypothetical protein